MKLTAVEDPARVANVGDTTLDLESAARAGVRWNIGVLSGAHTREALERAPHTRNHSIGRGLSFEVLRLGVVKVLKIQDLKTLRPQDLAGFNISSTMNTSVSSARTWIEALTLSTICELMPGCASTSRNAACVVAASRVERLEESVERVLRADGKRRRAVAIGLREPGQRRVESLQVIAKLVAVRGALVCCQTLRRIGQHQFVAGLDRVDATGRALLVRASGDIRSRWIA